MSSCLFLMHHIHDTSKAVSVTLLIKQYNFWQSGRNFLWHTSYFNCRNKTTYIKHPSVMNIDINNKWNQHNWSLIYKASQVASTLIPTINELNMIDSWYIKHNQVAWTLTSTINEIDTIDPWYLKHHKWHELWDYTRRKNTSNCKRPHFNILSTLVTTGCL